MESKQQVVCMAANSVPSLLEQPKILKEIWFYYLCNKWKNLL